MCHVFPCVPGRDGKTRRGKSNKTLRADQKHSAAQLDVRYGSGLRLSLNFLEAQELFGRIPPHPRPHPQEALGEIFPTQPVHGESFFLTMLGSSAVYWVFLLVLFSVQPFPSLNFTAAPTCSKHQAPRDTLGQSFTPSAAFPRAEMGQGGMDGAQRIWPFLGQNHARLSAGVGEGDGL